jgi:CheY-like chemotaxis protein
MMKTILLADDSLTIRKVVELTFCDTDIRVVAVRSGLEALERFGEIQPDLVLADVAMPGPTGYDVCERIKHSARPVPVVLLKGTFEPFDDVRAAACGADDQIVKPFESRVLLERVQALLSRVPEMVGRDRAVSDDAVEAVLRELDAVEFEPALPASAEPWIESEPAVAAAAPEEPSPWPFALGEEPSSGGEVGESGETPVQEIPDFAEPAVSAAPSLDVETTSDQGEWVVSEPSGVPEPPFAIDYTPDRPEPEPPKVAAPAQLTANEIDAVARAVIERLSDRIVREIAWDIVPDLAEILIRERIRELEREEDPRR